MTHVTAADAPGAMLAPVAPASRIGSLDMLRGWALFGVLWSNLNDWYNPLEPATALDRALSWVQPHLIESRFYSLLILLFGVGFGLQLTRASDRGLDVRNTYYRRSAALLAIGVVHGTLIWRGDILTIYALVAFALVMFRTATTRQILVAALLFFFLGPALVREAMFLSGLQIPVPNPSINSPEIYANGTWLQIHQIRVGGYLQWLGRWGLSSYVATLASFLIGLWAVKSGYLHRVLHDPRTTRRLLAVALVAAAVGYLEWQFEDMIWPRIQAPADFVAAFPFPYFQLDVLRGFVLRFFSWDTMGTALAYACALLLLWQTPRGERLLRPLAAAGRMALTTYLTQSIVCTLMFYGYGLGWYGTVSFTGMLLITLVLFGCQMAGSTWWLKRYPFGPVEWLWRKLTYARLAPLRTQPPVAGI